MKSISMKVNPLYSDVDLSIVFQFEFSKGNCKVGEAMVSTYSMDNSVTYRKSLLVPAAKVDKCAVIDQFDIIGDLEELCMKKLQHFLKVIGMKEIHSGYDMVMEKK
ncbi:hypothetical protein N5C46_15975 [Rossellomorea vietnamensis]|uniref:Uncharacterized protein n=1 Tax=Rossellomorea vietnamensis TaxID=218284 RepID=A0ACD4C3R1_9BACI|nr:hypothetical protein [Rossellomorea vietnamensis]UXH43180.1 hypothetical protein N5C46_15975 [Rossellomorea vietnamensis]